RGLRPSTVRKPLNDVEVRMKSAFNVRSRTASVEAFADSPNTATNTTNPRPIIRADAVAAVRRGLRIAFSRPSLPGTPARRIGAPRVPDTGLAISGVRLATPLNVG